MRADLQTALLRTRVATAAARRIRQASASGGNTPAADRRVVVRHGVTARDLRRTVTRVTARRGSTAETSGRRPASAADASLALMVKVGDHTIADDSSGFLSFPALALGADDPDTFALVHTASLVPTHDSIWRPPPGGTMLWDVWEQLLDEAVVVDPDPTPDQQAEIVDARRLLFSDPETAKPSEAYERYRRLLDEYLDAAAALADAAAGASGEPQPADIRMRHALEAAVDTAAQRLAVEGRQAEIAAALETIATYGLSQPSGEWADAREAFDLVTNRKRDANSNVEYPDTTFLPGSFDDAAWSPIELDADEISDLASTIATHFPRLAEESHLFDDALSDEEGTLRVKRLRAELTHLSVQRGDWFRPELLGLRCWRFRKDDAEPVSDGGDPATGRLPAFVTGLAIVRNVEIERVRVNSQDRRKAPNRRTEVATRIRSVADRIRSRLPLGTVRRTVRDHRSSPARPHVRDHRDPVPRVRLRPHEPVPSDPVPPFRDAAPRVAAFVCQLVPRSPDPDPALFPDLTHTEVAG